MTSVLLEPSAAELDLAMETEVLLLLFEAGFPLPGLSCSRNLFASTGLSLLPAVPAAAEEEIGLDASQTIAEPDAIIVVELFFKDVGSSNDLPLHPKSGGTEAITKQGRWSCL